MNIWSGGGDVTFSSSYINDEAIASIEPDNKQTVYVVYLKISKIQWLQQCTVSKILIYN